MQPATSPEATPHCSRNCELLLLVLLMAFTTLVFWTTDLDLRLADLFYDPHNPTNPWPYEQRMPWLLFYYGVPLFAALLAGGAALALLLGLLLPRLRALRLPAAMILLTLAIGPGLLINQVFKENMGRPRPHQVEQFGGDMQYIPPLAVGEPGVGKSFCSGHASVGFSLVVFWFLFRRRQPRLAWTFFLAALFLGLLLGVGRMAGGGHFFSDVLWAGYLTFFSAWLNHHFILRIPRREAVDGAPQAARSTVGQSPAAMVAYALVAAAVVVGALANYPVDKALGYTPDSRDLPSTLYLELDQADLQIRFGDGAAPFSIQGSARGFGLPNHRIEEYALPAEREGYGQVFLYKLVEEGLFTELNTRLTLRLDPDRVRWLVVRLKQGDIRVVPVTGKLLPKMHLKTESGRISGLSQITAGSAGP